MRLNAIYNILKGDLSESETIIQEMDINSSDDNYERELYRKYIDYLNLLSNDILKGNLDEQEVLSLESLSVGTDKPELMATNILNAFGYIKYEEPIYNVTMPSQLKIEKADKNNRNFYQSSNILTVYPNPATNNITVEYDLTGYENTVLQISDIGGNIKYNRQLKAEKNSIYINTENFVSGTYMISIFSDKNLIKTIKVVIN